MQEYDKTTTLSNVDGVLEFIQLVFLTDLGEGHMETFEKSNNIELDADFKFQLNQEITPFLFAFISDSIIACPSYNQSNYLNGVPIVRQYFLSHIDFRGPPQVA